MTLINAQPVQRQSMCSSRKAVPMARTGPSSTTDSVQVDDWHCRYLKDGRHGPGWYTYLSGQLILKIDDLPVAGMLLPLLEAARLGRGTQG